MCGKHGQRFLDTEQALRPFRTMAELMLTEQDEQRRRLV